MIELLCRLLQQKLYHKNWPRNALNLPTKPELITKEGVFANGIGSCRVKWLFSGNKLSCEYIFKVNNQIQLNRFRYTIVLVTPHSTYRIGTSFRLSDEGHRAEVIRDDFQAN